jgi:hypothetical protein
MLVHHRLPSILRRIRQDVATLRDREAINTARREEGYTWKDRLLKAMFQVSHKGRSSLRRSTWKSTVP